ncbi:MAG TPA: cytochrome c [Candidatus Tumulicola sp.]
MNCGRTAFAALAICVLSACARHPAGTTPSRAPGSSSDGGALYAQHCASCHQTDGRGLAGVFPPLAGDPVVNGNAGGAISAVAQGMRGRIEVNGVTYEGVMPGWSGDLDDEQVAAVVTFVRSAWHNHAPPVSASDVSNAARR